MTWRLKAIGLAFICFAAAAVNGFFAGKDLVKLVAGLMQLRPMVSSDQYTLTGLLLTPMAVGIGLLFLFSKPVTPQQLKDASKRSTKWTGRFLVFIVASLVSALIATIPQYWTVNYLALQRGYVPCPKPSWPRHQNDRWALPGPHGATQRCPGEGTDPNL